MENFNHFVDSFFTREKITEKTITQDITNLLREGFTKDYMFTTLVEQSNISRIAERKIGKLAHALRELKPDMLFVYKLMQGDETIYIGQSKGLYKRLYVHKRSKTFDRVFIHYCKSKHEMDTLENYLILKNKPKLNKDLNLWLASEFTGEEPVFEPITNTTCMFTDTLSYLEGNEKKEKYLTSSLFGVGVRNVNNIVPYWL
ncbi:MAG: GIY-YIG nuclease family protein [Colwellia sp.]|nr:GIY-YIG nuclease family protein [Colwellia sp.]